MENPPQIHTDYQLTEANRRLGLLNRLAQMKAEGISMARAAEILGEPAPNLCRWRKAYQDSGQNFNSLIPKVTPGRPSVAAKLEKQIGLVALQKVVNTVQGHNADMESNRGAWRYCATTQDLPQIVKEVILDESKASKQNIARSLLTRTHVTRAERLAHRGRRALRLLGSSVPRFIDVLPGDVFVTDDMTPIWGWWVPWPQSPQYPYGRKVLQGQLLGIVDHASQCRIAFMLLAREKSRYRAVDIWSFFGDVFEDVGLPRLGFHLEGGVWQTNVIRGVQVEYEEGEPSADRRIGALNSLPTNLLPYHHETANGDLPGTLSAYRSCLPKSKIIEQTFNNDQRIQGTLWGSLGRDQRRKPFEKAQKIFEACKRGAADPALHFLSLAALHERLVPMMQYLNQDKMEGDIYRGRPGDLWKESIAKNPLLKLPADRRWLFRHDWRVRTLKGAFIDVSFKNSAGEARKAHYHNAKLFAERDGQEVTVYFDSEHPERPAEIVSLVGQHLGQAEFWTGTGAFIARNTQGFEIQNRWARTVVTLSRTIQQNAPSLQVPPEIAQARTEARSEARLRGRIAPDSPTSGRRGAATPAGGRADPEDNLCPEEVFREL